MFLAFEGADGCGKSTQVKLLAEHLERRSGRRVVVLQEPGGTPLGLALRELLLSPATGGLSVATEVFLFMAARSHLVATRIRPALDAGDIVLCDRFLWSSVVYQGVVGGLGAPVVLRLARLAIDGTAPLRTFLLDVPVDVAARRRRERRDADRFERRDDAFHERVRAGFLEVARAHPRKIVIIDADADPATVHRRIVEKLPRERLAARRREAGR